MPEEIQAEWPCYRLVVKGYATMTEIETLMSINDVDKLWMAVEAGEDAQPVKG